MSWASTTRQFYRRTRKVIFHHYPFFGCAEMATRRVAGDSIPGYRQQKIIRPGRGDGKFTTQFFFLALLPVCLLQRCILHVSLEFFMGIAQPLNGLIIANQMNCERAS
jgi:hypothetical protein